jgi:hypothetical protein
VVEPVNAILQRTRPGHPIVHILDHDGVNTKNISVANNAVLTDTARDTSPYYIVEYK